MKEIWKDIPKYEGFYEISNHGNVRKKNGRRLKGQTNGLYREIMLTKNGKRKKYKIHRLVAEVFLEKPKDENAVIINHKDENPSNNHVDNLEWCTYKYNTNYGTCVKRRARKHQKCIVQIKDGKIIRKWNSIKTAAQTLGIDSSSITKAAKRKRPSAGGFNWRYDC